MPKRYPAAKKAAAEVLVGFTQIAKKSKTSHTKEVVSGNQDEQSVADSSIDEVNPSKSSTKSSSSPKKRSSRRKGSSSSKSTINNNPSESVTVNAKSPPGVTEFTELAINNNNLSAASASSSENEEDNDDLVFEFEISKTKEPVEKVDRYLPETDHYRRIFLSSVAATNDPSPPYSGEMNADFIPSIYMPMDSSSQPNSNTKPPKK